MLFFSKVVQTIIMFFSKVYDSSSTCLQVFVFLLMKVSSLREAILSFCNSQHNGNDSVARQVVEYVLRFTRCNVSLANLCDTTTSLHCFPASPNAIFGCAISSVEGLSHGQFEHNLICNGISLLVAGKSCLAYQHLTQQL